MSLYNELIDSFPSDFKGRVKIETGRLTDSIRWESFEIIEKYLKREEYVAAVEGVIKEFDTVPRIIINYPYGEPMTVKLGEKVMKYEQDCIYINFLT